MRIAIIAITLALFVGCVTTEQMKSCADACERTGTVMVSVSADRCMCANRPYEEPVPVNVEAVEAQDGGALVE